MRAKYQVFISSTYSDLVGARQKVFEKLIRRRIFMPVGMENFEAAHRTPWELITRRIDECDYMITILGDRIGSVGPDGRSYTEMEYDYAAENNIPTVAFLKRNFNPKTVSRLEIDEASLIHDFREKCKKYHVAFWDGIDELGDEVVQAVDALIDDFPRKGWVRGSYIDSGLPFALGVSGAAKYNLSGRWRTIFIEPDPPNFNLVEEEIDLLQDGTRSTGTLNCISYDRLDYFVNFTGSGEYVFGFHSADKHKMYYGGTINLRIRQGGEFLEGICTWEATPGHHVDQSKYVWFRLGLPKSARYQRAAMKLMKAELERVKKTAGVS